MTTAPREEKTIGEQLAAFHREIMPKWWTTDARAALAVELAKDDGRLRCFVECNDVGDGFRLTALRGNSSPVQIGEYIPYPEYVDFVPDKLARELRIERAALTREAEFVQHLLNTIGATFAHLREDE